MNPPTRPQHSSEMPQKTTVPAEPEPFRTTFASLSLHRTDRIRLLQFPDHIIVAIRTIIQRFSNKGIQDERILNTSHEFKLRGNPWTGMDSESIPSRLLMREMLAYLFSQGWISMASTNISKNEFDQDTIFFRRQLPPPPPSIWLAISFNKSDRLQLIGAPADLITGFRELLENMKLLQDGGIKDEGKDVYEFKCIGRPWRAMAEETMNTRRTFLRMLELLESIGWSLYASLNQNNGRADMPEAESWYCVKEQGWTPGKTVFHR